MNESQRVRIFKKSASNGVEQQLGRKRILMHLLDSEVYIVHRMRTHCS